MEKINLGLVAAREGSKGIPKKNLIKLNGKTLVSKAVEIGLQCSVIDFVVCSTDSIEIAEEAKAAGASIPFIRPKRLAEDKTPMLPVIEHAIKEIEISNNFFIDSITILDPTAPLRTVDDITKVYKFFVKSKADLVVSVNKCHQNPYFNMLEKKERYFTVPVGEKLNFGSRQEAPEVFSINTLCWIYSRNAILKEKKDTIQNNCF